MSKVKPGRQEILNILTLLAKDRKLHQTSIRVSCLLIFIFLWLLNWKMFLATFVGIALMSGCYLLQNSHWQKYCRQWHRFLVGSNGQLLLAVGTGATGAFFTYLAASVWANTENQWLATGAILQGFASLTTLGILLWSLWGRKAHNLEIRLEASWSDLSHQSHLKRLVAIRQSTRLVSNNRLASEYYWQTIEYYRLMLSEPQVPMVKNALLESLNVLGGEKILSQPAPVKIPLKLPKVKLKNTQSEKHLI